MRARPAIIAISLRLHEVKRRQRILISHDELTVRDDGGGPRLAAKRGKAPKLRVSVWRGLYHRHEALIATQREDDAVHPDHPAALEAALRPRGLPGARIEADQVRIARPEHVAVHEH